MGRGTGRLRGERDFAASSTGGRNELTNVTPTRDEIARILELRRGRSRILGEDLFSDPAWDILLELYSAKLANRRTALGDLAAIAPPSTIARWVAALEERALVECEVNPLDPGQLWIALSSDGAERMTRFLGGRPTLRQSS